VVRASGEIRWCFTSAAASVDANDRVLRVSGVTIDITARKLAEQRQLLLTREVDHRARNVLALVQSIVKLTRAEDVMAFSHAVEGRITALARVHKILSLSSWEGAELGRLIEEELAPFMTTDASRVVLSGPAIQLEPATAQTLALALHELTTNAAKYGALSSLEGSLELVWSALPEGLELKWRETAGPPVQVPARQGFGTRSVITSVETQLGGQASFDWRPEGLYCRLLVPVAELGARQTAPAGARPKSNGVSREVALQLNG
jgi:two-component sensor histidine kinase